MPRGVARVAAGTARCLRGCLGAARRRDRDNAKGSYNWTGLPPVSFSLHREAWRAWPRAPHGVCEGCPGAARRRGAGLRFPLRYSWYFLLFRHHTYWETLGVRPAQRGGSSTDTTVRGRGMYTYIKYKPLYVKSHTRLDCVHLASLKICTKFGATYTIFRAESI